MSREEKSEAAAQEPLLPPIRRNPTALLVPLVLLLAALSACFWLYNEYLAPSYAAEQSSYERALENAEAYEGELVQEKSSDECFKLLFQRDTTMHSICVSEELWSVQTVGEPFDISSLREEAHKQFDLFQP